MAFPDTIETFENAKNIEDNDASIVKSYVSNMATTDVAEAATIIRALKEQKIVNADQLNQYQQLVNRIQSYISSAKQQKVVTSDTEPTVAMNVGDFWWDTSNS